MSCTIKFNICFSSVFPHKKGCVTCFVRLTIMMELLVTVLRGLGGASSIFFPLCTQLIWKGYCFRVWLLWLWWRCLQTNDWVCQVLQRWIWWWVIWRPLAQEILRLHIQRWPTPLLQQSGSQAPEQEKILSFLQIAYWVFDGETLVKYGEAWTARLME